MPQMLIQNRTFHYALSNTAQYIPMSSAGATYSVNLKTINITYDGLISTRALSRIETADNTNHKNLPAGTSMNVSDIKLKESMLLVLIISD